MKFEPDKEMEQLLRAHVERGAAQSASAAAAARGPLPDEEHLDADELSAFAENTLPPAARARYTIHLADCDRCRGIVAGLSSAANIAGALEQSSQAVSVPTTNLNDQQRGWLAGLFSLPGLRFALPVLAFMVIGGIVWRAYEVPRANHRMAEAISTSASESEQEDVEQSKSTTAAQTASAPEVADNKKAGNDQSKNELSKKAAENVGGPTSKSGSGNEAQTSAFSPAPAAPPPALAARQDQAAAAPQQDGNASKQKETRDERSAAAEEKVEVANSDAQPSAEKARSDEPRGAAASSVAAPRRQAPGKTAEADDKMAASDSAIRQREAAPNASAAGGAQKDETKNRVMKAQRAVIADEAEASKPSETRSVGGRSFQRRGGVWTDTAYVSGSAAVNIKRGSEQYRALVADEPTLRAISERLSGDVIVVWKGRTYRFR